MLPTRVPVVLLADDDASIRKFLRYMLERDGYEIIECADGALAVAAFQRQRPDVVLMDIRMPELDGIAACEQIQQLPGGPQVPVLMITALSDRASIDRCFEAGAIDFITKPINHTILRQRVRRLVRARQAEDALRESEARYRDLFENSPIGIYRTTPDGRILAANPALVRLLGYDSFEALAQRNLETDPTAVQDRIAFKQQIERDGEMAGREGVWRRRTGDRIEVRENARLIRADEGQPLYYDGTVEDITEYLRAAEALRESEEKYRFMTENSSDVIWHLDRHYCFDYISPADEHLRNFTREEVLGTTLWSWLKPASVEYVKQMNAQRLADEQTRTRPATNRYELEIICKDGRWLWMEINVTVHYDQNGELVGYHGIARDITARKQAEAEIARLYQAEQAQRQLAEALRDTAAQLTNTLNLDEVLDRVLDNVGRVVPHQGAHVILLDNGVVHLTRTRGLEALNPLDLSAHLSPADLPALRVLTETGQPYVIHDALAYTEWGQLPHTPQLRAVLGVPVRFKQQLLGFLILMSDTPGYFTPTHAERLQTFADQAAIAIENARLYLAERQHLDRWQQAQAVLAQSEKLAALGRLAAALAHEINNPLQAIQSHLELVLDFPLEAGERREFLQIARQEINRLSQLTRNVLNFARPTPGPRRAAVITDLIRQTLALAGKQLQHNHIQVTTDLQPTPPVFVAAEQLTQVFLNLVLNAAEAVQQAGQLHIAAGIERDQIVISFSNNGPAIRPEDLPHIFEPFYTTKPGGTGLGLSISHRLIQQHGGTLIAENVTETRGVVFKINLPLTPMSGPPA